MGNLPYFYVTDGTAANKVDFFSLRSPYHLLDWTPATAKLKNDGVWQSSPFWDGRRLIASARENISDALIIAVSGGDMDTVIDNMRKLRLILEKAVYYWTSEWQREPVYLVARGDCETNTRYAIIKGYSMPNDDNPYEPPLGGVPASKAMVNIVLNIEHGLWQHVIPGTSEQVAIKSTDCWDYPYSLEFNGDTSIVNCGSDAGIDNLADNAFTAEAWVYALYSSSIMDRHIFDKTNAAANGWFLCFSPSWGLYGRVYCAVTNASTFSGVANIQLNQWNHVAMTWDDAADRKNRLFINGQSFGTPVAGNGAIVVDAAFDLFIGANPVGGNNWSGYIGWSRISNFVRYGGVFQPPPRCIIPQVDAGTLGLWIHEGTGTAIDNIEGTAARDGVAANCTWHSDCCDDYD
jgi:hypothetical protein